MYLLAVFLLFCITFPIQIFNGCLIIFCSGFPVLFTQKRIGKDGKPFVMYKFRTMENGAEKKQDKLKKFNEANGPVFKIHDDPRFTGIGKFLSHTGLDELPQLWNIVKGDMALIGPRPLPCKEANKLTRWQQERQKVKPGIISPWVLNGYHSKSFQEWMKSDVVYAEKKSFLYDAKLVIQAIPFIVRLFLQEIVG